MKHDDTTLQAAIDAAMIEIGRQDDERIFVACPDEHPISWYRDATIRLALAKAFLAKLPEPIQTDHIALADLLCSIGWSARNDAQWENLQKAMPQIAAMFASKTKPETQPILADDGRSLTELQAENRRLEKEVELLKKVPLRQMVQQREREVNHWCDLHAVTYNRAEKAEAELAALKSSQLGILRPISEAGPVPDGCVRVQGSFDPVFEGGGNGASE